MGRQRRDRCRSRRDCGSDRSSKWWRRRPGGPRRLAGGAFGADGTLPASAQSPQRGTRSRSKRRRTQMRRTTHHHAGVSALGTVPRASGGAGSLAAPQLRTTSAMQRKSVSRLLKSNFNQGYDMKGLHYFDRLTYRFDRRPRSVLIHHNIIKAAFRVIL
mmetsp:Transcript_31593/g.76447  ORF Transcript_31593/g.76447 Transcript_31593/m.76447 type:complete len:159 (-) Transcript_31593:81-557(-)